MVLARALTFGGAIALAVASAFAWFGIDFAKACGWTCYSPRSVTDDEPPKALLTSAPSTAYGALGTWASIALAVVVVGAVLALVLDLVGRRVPPALVGVVALGAAIVLVRVVTQPGLGARELSNDLVEVRAPAYVGVVGALVAAAGVALLAAARRRRLESPVA